MAEDGTIRVEVAAALPDRQELLVLNLPSGSTLGEAVERSEIARRLPGIEIDPGRLGIFGQRRSADTVLRDGDRVEIYRPLRADPKEVRRQMAELERKRRS
ncbi:RnfH family protein [Wenzhouxiangella sp. AB-CW3]|uniref:RnfH family protein n=1 Tax=Wenzhouxiangella sp. AB-CW3 TaxID=2771012 RepID=UPI00168B7AA5|nr:RnfH family protein [Wenzhouxiangella sp. AB-CW3]QOC23710.1 RnfH family protein [Wenzhouxiangella sp. AB-CW3]